MPVLSSEHIQVQGQALGSVRAAMEHALAYSLERRQFGRFLADFGFTQARLAASGTATWVAGEAVRTFGGYGYMRDHPVERLLRDAKGPEIDEGTNEIMRHVIAREVLRAARAG